MTNRIGVIAFITVLAFLLFLPPIPGQPAEQKMPQAQKSVVAPPPAAIPAPEIAKRAEEAAKLVRDLEGLTVSAPAMDEIQERLPEVKARLVPLLESTLDTLTGDPANPVVERMVQSWEGSRLELARWIEILTKRATELEAALNKLTVLRAIWTQTRSDAQTSRAPAAVIRRVDSVLADIDSMRTRLQAQRAAALVLQDRVGQEMAQCQDALDRIAQYKQGRLMRTFTRGTPPIWSRGLPGREFEELPSRASEAAVASLGVLRQFAGAHAARIVLQALIFIGMVFVAWGARRWAQRRRAAGDTVPSWAAVFDHPYSAAALVALPSIFWLYPDRPQTVVDMVGMLLLVPALRIVRPHIRPPLAPMLYGFAVLCLIDRIRAELAVIPLADQILLMLIMLAAMAGLCWRIGSGRLRRALATEPNMSDWWPAYPTIAMLALVISAASFLAAAYGMMRLARLLGAGLLVGIMMGLVAYCAVKVTDGIVGFALRVWPFRVLGMVRKHRHFLQHRVHVLTCWVAAFAWIVGTLRFHGLLNQAVVLGQAALDAEIRRGAMGISLGDILAFILTVWVAFLISGFIRFVLDEDVYPRLHLTRGVPYVISSLLHYVIIFLGFLLAVAALGIDLNKITILAGAFGVGLGFGLQGVVNNFVSGLIVLFERPVRVGDAIQMGDVAGEVQRIGMRMTMVRTGEGADVIVPNASLVSEKVTNWTHSNVLRRMDVPVGVAYGTAPEKVRELLLEVARAHPGVLAEPAPQALFLGFGESALQFELRAWTNQFNQWFVIRSELCVSIYNAICAAGMTFPYPRRVVQLSSDGQTEFFNVPVRSEKERRTRYENRK